MATQTGSFDFKAAKLAKDSAEATASADATAKANQAEANAKKVATNFLSADSAGIMVYDGESGQQQPSSPSANTSQVLIDSNGMYVRIGSTSLASFTGSSAQIGQNSAAHSVVDTNGMRVYASDGATQIANLGYGQVVYAGATQTGTYYTFGKRIGNIPAYSSSSTYDEGDLCMYNNMMFVCIVKISTPEAFNTNHWELTGIGGGSVAEGLDIHAGGHHSHAEGHETVAAGAYSHAEGTSTVALNNASHAEGYGTVADATSHAEGRDTKAMGLYSHSQNHGTIANGDRQTALGKYNIADTTNAVIIGNGTADNARSNALTVDWNGNVNIASGAKYKINGNNLSASDIANSVTGVKGNAESSYRTGNVNITPANIGAVPTTRTVNSKALSSNITLSASDVSAVALDDKYKRSATGDLEWTSTTDGDAKVIAKSALAFWNGAYSGNSSNLSKCSTGNIIGSNGGTMTGQLKTSFKESVAMGSYGASASTVDGLVTELRYSSGCMGSASISTTYTKGSVTIGTGWYNFIYSPHRSGGANGAASGDNCNYGNLLLMGMTVSGAYLIRVASAAIQEVKILGSDYVRATFTPTSGSSYSSYGGCYYEKYGRVVHVHVGVSGLSTGASTNIYTLPSGYRPTSPVYAHGTGGSWNNIGYMEISTAGVVTVRSQGTYCGADVTFMT